MLSQPNGATAVSLEIVQDRLMRQKEHEAQTERINKYQTDDLNMFFPDVLPMLEAARECADSIRRAKSRKIYFLELVLLFVLLLSAKP